MKKPIDPAATFPLELFVNDPVLYNHAKIIKEKLKELSDELA